MRRPLLVALALLALLLVPAPAGAQAPPAPPPPPAQLDERAAAREFAFGAYRLRVAILAQREEIERRGQALADPRCYHGQEEAPPHARAWHNTAFSLLLVDALFGPTRPAFAAFLAELERVPTWDRTLRSGRAGWRKALRLVSALPAPPPDVCQTFTRWRRADYAREAAPPSLESGSLVEYIERSSGLERKAERAAVRLRELGVQKGAAERFAGQTLFAGVLEEALGVEEEVLPPPRPAAPPAPPRGG